MPRWLSYFFWISITVEEDYQIVEQKILLNKNSSTKDANIAVCWLKSVKIAKVVPNHTKEHQSNNVYK